MATLKELVSDLKQSDLECRISIFTPSGLGVPCHFHITEIGRTVKSFVDCGGVKRETGDTTFQVWVADDTEHRMTVGKFLKIIDTYFATAKCVSKTTLPSLSFPLPLFSLFR